MAHQQLPLNNSLGVGGNNRHLDPTNRFDMSRAETSGYPELNIGQQNLQLPHSNSFNSFPPPPYPHTEERYIGSSTGNCASSSASMLHSPTQHHHVSGSLPPITSFGVRQSPSLAQLTNIGGSDSSQQSSAATMPMASTSSHSSAACSPSPSPYQQHNNHHSHFSQMTTVTNTSSMQHFLPNQQPMQRLESGGQFCTTNSHGQQSPIGHGQNHHQFQPQQMPSPAYSAHPANSISNPGSIVSAPPESPSSIRSSSVRSNYSLRLVNSTPDSFMQNNSNSEHQYSQDALIHQQQDGQMPSSGANNLPTQKTPQALKNTKRNYTPRTQRIKTPVLPLFQLDGPNPVITGEGPTVRQHLQQQQAANKQKMQQEMMLKRLKKDGELSSGANGDRDDNKRTHVESAPPSVAATTMESGGASNSFGGFQLAEWSSASGSSHLQKITMVAGSVQQIPKAESLSPPKKNAGANRSRNGSQMVKRTGVQVHSNTAGSSSSSEALASTIASVASGGGSLEEFEKFSGPGSSPSPLLTNSITVHPGPSSSAEQNFSPTSSSAPKRRKTAANTQPQKMVLAAPTRQIEATDNVVPMLEKKIDPTLTNAQHQTEQISPSKQPQQQQCRIHVQNPPQHGDFPLTGTKIQVVHMQPSPAASAISTASVPSPQTECSPRSYLSSRQQQAEINAHQQSSPFTAGTGNNTGMTSPDSTHSARNAAIIPPYHAAPPQPPQRQFLAPPTPGTPIPNSGQSQQMAATATTPPIQSLPTQGHNDFHHPNAIINRQYCGGGGGVQMPKYPTPLRPSQHLQSQQSSKGSPLVPKQEMLVLAGGVHSPSPQSQQFGPHYMAPMAAPPPPPTPVAPSPQQMFRFHHQQSPLGTMQPSQTPPQQAMAAPSYHHQQQQAAMMQQQSPQNHYPHSQQQPCFMGRAMADQMGETSASLPPQQHSPMFSTLHQHPPPPHLPQQYINQSRYMSTPPQHHSPHLQQLLHQTSPIQASHSSGTLTTNPSPGPPLEQIQMHNSACQTVAPLHVGPSQSTSHPRAQLSRAQLMSRNSRELECQDYAIKLYHLQRTIKALVYKNGALGDELARLNQRIHIVTEERKILAKRLQHHERNRIRRIQTHFRKAAAAAAIKEESCQPIAGTSSQVETKAEINNSLNGSLCGTDEAMEEKEADIMKKKREDEGGGGEMRKDAEALEINCQQMLSGTSTADPSPIIPPMNLQQQLKIGTLEQNCVNSFFPNNNLLVSPQSDGSDISSGSGINGGGIEHSSMAIVGQRMTLRSRTASSNSTREAATIRELSISPAEQLGGQSGGIMKTSKGQHEQRSRHLMRRTEKQQIMETDSLDQNQSLDEKILPTLEGQSEMDSLDGHDDQERQFLRTKRQQILNSTHKQSMESKIRQSTAATMTTRRQSMAIQQAPPDNQQSMMNCIGSRHLTSSISPDGGADQQQQNRRRTTNSTAAATTVGSQRRS